MLRAVNRTKRRLEHFDREIDRKAFREFSEQQEDKRLKIATRNKQVLVSPRSFVSLLEEMRDRFARMEKDLDDVRQSLMRDRDARTREQFSLGSLYNEVRNMSGLLLEHTIRLQRLDTMARARMGWRA